MKMLRVLPFLLIFFLNSALSQNHYLLNSDHIPLMGYDWAPWGPRDALYPLLKDMGIEGIMMSGVPENSYHLMNEIKDFTKLIPYQGNDSPSRFIAGYTESNYSEFKATTTDIHNLDSASLWYNPEISNRLSNDEIVTNSSQPDWMIRGPGYHQLLRYYFNIGTDELLYTADFKLRISPTGPPPEPPDQDDHVVCIINIKAYKIIYNDIWRKVDPILIGESDTLRVNMFNNFEWTIFPKTYDLDFILKSDREEYVIRQKRKPDLLDIEYVSYLEYEIEWVGPDYLQLHFDKITLSDQRAIDLMTSHQTHNNITFQANNRREDGVTSLFNTSDTDYKNTVVGLYGNDEPGCIDQLLPIRKVNDLLNTGTLGKRPLFISAAMNWNTLWIGHPFGSDGGVKMKEFISKSKLDAFIMQTHIYHTPHDTDYERNIEIYADHLKVLLNLMRNPETRHSFYILVQTGKWGDYIEIDPDTSQLSYSVYLALLYGARGIFLDQLFWINNTDIRGIINPFTSPPTISPLFNEVKQKLSPQLKGLFGKTLSKAVPGNQYVRNSTADMPELVRSVQEEGRNSTLSSVLDIGFFSHSDYKCFMILNRWYGSPITIHALLNPVHLEGYINWNLTNLIDSTSETLNSSHIINSINIPAGYASFYGLAPVIKMGGDIVYNETITGNNALNNSLTIKQGAVLTIASGSTYNIFADIVVDSLAHLQVQSGSVLNFYNNAALYVKGSLTCQPGAVFNFNNSSRDECIRFENNSVVNINGCTFSNGSNCLVLNNTRSTVTIKNNLFINFESAVSVSNAPQLIFQRNSITNSEMGLFVSNVANAFIINNNFQTTKEINLPGIFFHSSSGSIRANTVMGHSTGILVANSSPQLGTNNLLYNNYHGLYVAPGSIPDLRAYWMMNEHCSSAPVYYPISGFNHIIQNGGRYNEPMDDGSEIYLSKSSVLMDYGCNDVLDNRQLAYPPFTVKNIICGEPDVTAGSILYLRQNNWGDTLAYALSERFCNLSVNFEQYNEPCPAPDRTAGCEYVVMAPDGTVIDTLLPMAISLKESTEMESLIAEADQKFNSQMFTEAKAIYQQLILNYPEVKENITSYAKLLMIERITGLDGFVALKGFYESRLSTLSDTLMRKMVMHLSNLCLVNEYLLDDAIANYQEIIDSNTGSEEAIMAEIDIYTANLLEENWGSFRKRMVKGIASRSELIKLLKTRYGAKTNQLKEVEIPKEFIIFQNYPNPFNPETTIKFGIPNDSRVELVIYDILGRKVITLIDDYKPAGFYQVKFNADKLSSGLYIYQIRTKEHTATRKMMLLK